MKIALFIFLIAIVISCKNEPDLSQVSKFDDVVQFYENGNIKSVGSYKSDCYTQCCFAGPCEQIYIYKVGEWKYHYENGQLKAKGTYKLGTKRIRTSCEGGDTVYFGYVTDNWEFYNMNTLKIPMSSKLIEEIESDNPFYEKGMLME